MKYGYLFIYLEKVITWHAKVYVIYFSLIVNGRHFPFDWLQERTAIINTNPIIAIAFFATDLSSTKETATLSFFWTVHSVRKLFWNEKERSLVNISSSFKKYWQVVEMCSVYLMPSSTRPDIPHPHILYLTQIYDFLQICTNMICTNMICTNMICTNMVCTNMVCTIIWYVLIWYVLIWYVLIWYVLIWYVLIWYVL